MIRSLNLDPKLTCVLLAALLALALVAALFVGPTSIGISAALKGVFGFGDTNK